MVYNCTTFTMSNQILIPTNKDVMFSPFPRTMMFDSHADTIKQVLSDAFGVTPDEIQVNTFRLRNKPQKDVARAFVLLDNLCLRLDTITQEVIRNKHYLKVPLTGKLAPNYDKYPTQRFRSVDELDVVLGAMSMSLDLQSAVEGLDGTLIS